MKARAARVAALCRRPPKNKKAHGARNWRPGPPDTRVLGSDPWVVERTKGTAMCLIQRSAFGLIFGGGLAVAGGFAGVACGGDNFDGCQASRTCDMSPAGAGGAATAGRGSESAAGKAGQGGASGIGGKAGAGATAGNGPKGGASAKGEAGSPDDAGAGNAPSMHGGHGSGGTHDGVMSEGGSGDTEPRPTGTGGSRGDTGGEAGMAGETTGPLRDTKPPSVAMVTTQGSSTPWPDTGAKGVKEDDVIVVAFDEPMDTTTTAAGYASTDLPANTVQFSWDATKTRLSIQPLVPLKYADVSDPAASGKQYTFVIGTGFHDLAGNALVSSKTVVFMTLRHVTHSLSVEPGGGATITQPASGAATTSIRCESANDHVTAGDDADDAALFSVVMFDLAPLPDGIAQWNSATLMATFAVSQSIPFGDSRLGTLLVFSTSTAPDAVTWDSGIDLGLFSRYASTTTPDLDVTSTVAADYLARASKRNLSEYMFRFDKQTDADGIVNYAYLYCDDLKLALDYVAP